MRRKNWKWVTLVKGWLEICGLRQKRKKIMTTDDEMIVQPSCRTVTLYELDCGRGREEGKWEGGVVNEIDPGTRYNVWSRTALWEEPLSDRKVLFPFLHSLHFAANVLVGTWYSLTRFNNKPAQNQLIHQSSVLKVKILIAVSNWERRGREKKEEEEGGKLPQQNTNPKDLKSEKQSLFSLSVKIHEWTVLWKEIKSRDPHPFLVTHFSFSFSLSLVVIPLAVIYSLSSISLLHFLFSFPVLLVLENTWALFLPEWRERYPPGEWINREWVPVRAFVSCY